MKLVTRAALGWPPSAAPLQSTTSGVKIHYEGTPVSTRLLTDHDACIAEWKAIRASHLANTAENYSDVAYNYAACPHGYLLEGRGIGRRTGANGNQELNRAHYAIVGLVGSSGLTEPTDAMLHAIRDGIELLRQNGAGPEIKGHRDGFATACPGGPLYAWVQRGAPRPGTTTPPPEQEDDMDPVDVWAYKGTGETRDAYWYQRDTNTLARQARDETRALAARVDDLETTGLTAAQAEQIAELVADKLAARLTD
ncbi:peptidoglycan recognition family protein [Streptomyces exfoliatus]|uniref:Peptidoglycan recognition family protein n=1 Tax=Streptomyces exfoliatus TaxID=1905 RepID=A0ABV3CSY8_STREX